MCTTPNGPASEAMIDRVLLAKGYLRTGKILQLMGKDALALGIYRYGLRKVSDSDPKLQLLRDICQQMKQKCEPGMPQDPLTVLPPEVAEMVMSYLDFRQVVSLTRVSTSWREFLKSVPNLWTSLDFSNAAVNIPQNAIRKLVEFLGEVNPRALPSLQILELRDCDETLESFSDLSTIVTPDLRIGGIIELSLPFASNLEMNTLLQLLGSAPLGLRKLNLFHCAMITAVDLSSLIRMGYLDSVVDLDLSGTPVTDTVIESLTERAHGLKTIGLSQTAITGVAIKALLRNGGSKLQQLDIRRCYHISSDAFAFAREMKGLRLYSRRDESKGKKKVRYE
ncbi:MAG: hypothetical protein Q9182_000262 [Xanthomendoza sp. 2 TL-2023]